MTNANISRVWAVVGLFLLGYTINAFLHDRGAGAIVKQALLDDRHVPNDYYSIIIVGFTLGLLCIVGCVYQRRVLSQTNVNRLPIVGFRRPEMSDWKIRVYQWFFYIVLVVLPSLALLQFWGQMTSHGRLFEDIQIGQKDAPLEGQALNTFRGLVKGFTTLPNGKRICLVTTDDVYRFSGEFQKSGSPCSNSDMKGWSGGADFLPIISPALLVGATLIGWLGALYLSYSIWKQPKQSV